MFVADPQEVESWKEMFLTPQRQRTAATAYTNTMSSAAIVNRKMSLKLASVICTAMQPEREVLVFVIVPSSIGRPVPLGGGCILFEQFLRGAWSQHCSTKGSSPAVQRALPPSASALARRQCPDLVLAIAGQPRCAVGCRARRQ